MDPTLDPQVMRMAEEMKMINSACKRQIAEDLCQKFGIPLVDLMVADSPEEMFDIVAEHVGDRHTPAEVAAIARYSEPDDYPPVPTRWDFVLEDIIDGMAS